MAVVITVVWAISYLVDILSTSYSPPIGLHAVMMIVAGAVFGSGFIKRNGGNGNGGPK